LRDTHAIHSVVLRAYHLRNPNPEFGFKGGEKLDKAMIDKLLDASVKRVAVVGKGDPVSAQPGTMALIILIFLGLTYTLQIILWDPVLKIIDERKKEIEDGSYLVRQNRRDEIRIQEEAVKLRSDARRSYLNKLMATQNQARSEADKIYREARIEGKLMRDKAQSELNKVVDEVRGELKPQVPELAREIANQLLNRA
jgi:F-type H+-transporting ATPase subunit b